MLYSDIGFVIKKNDLLNDDRILQLFLKEHGKISCIAKGAKKFSSRKSGNLELLNLCKFSLAEGKNLDVLTEVQLINPYGSLREKEKDVFFLFYLDELVTKMVYDGEISAEIYNVLEETLSYHESHPDGDVIKSIAYVHCKLLLFSGVFLELYTCLICNDKIVESDEKVYKKSGIAHKRCGAGSEISNDEIKMLRFMKERTLPEVQRISLTSSLKSALYLLTMDMIEYTIGSSIRSKAFIHE